MINFARTALAAAAISAALGAQTPGAGIQVDAHFDGLGLGASYQIDMKEGHTFLPRFSVSPFSCGEETHTKIGIGIDYRFFTEEKANDGLFLGAGISTYHISGTTALSLGITGGFMLTKHWGIEARLETTRYPETLYYYHNYGKDHVEKANNGFDGSLSCAYRF